MRELELLEEQRVVGAGLKLLESPELLSIAVVLQNCLQLCVK